MSGSISDCATLNNGVRLPWLGLGVYGIDDGDPVARAVTIALEGGYRAIDTASIYRNERGVGQGMKASGIPREDIFLTTKVWNDDQRAGRTLKAFDESLSRLGTDYVDLYLVHWPVAGCYRKTWTEMEAIYRSGRARAIGVSNFLPGHLDDLLQTAEVVPAVNQVEFHPHLVQPDLLAYCRSKDIRLEAWSPLMQGQVTDDADIADLAKKYGKTPAQVVLRWDLQHGVVTIPKSATPSRILENADLFDFELSADDMRRLDGLDRARRLGPDPADFDF